MALRTILSTLFIFVSLQVSAEIRPVAPEPEVTPGELCTTKNPDFKEFRYDERIPYCERNVSTGRKTFIYEVYAVRPSVRHKYTIDHLIPLSLGGSNSDENLWPEHKAIKALRQNLEWDLYLELSRGQITQEEAVEIIHEAKFNPPVDIQAFEGVFYSAEDLL